ncbi:MAG: hypothetical protein DLM73_00395 [Chthoniobacterales bacterium]|nr:MAG: hypothetical protein DLM73_00395 [Chthoniobacterales bacterium]
MKKFVTLIALCALALATGANAAQEDPNNPKAPVKSKAVQKHPTGPKQNFAPKQHVQSVRTQNTTNLNSTKIHQNNVSKEQFRKSTNVESKKLPAVQSNKIQTDKLQSSEARTKKLQTDQLSKKTQKTEKLQTNQLPAVQNNWKNAVVPNKGPVPNIQKIHAQHLNFHAKAKTSIASVQFNQNYQIQGAQNWKGPQYRVFQSYRPQWHDRGWWRSRYSDNLLLIGGGWYYWQGGYWYPAWGYDNSAAYYPYDGPIYVGDNRVPFDQIVADVQASLQEQGYYKGEVDGLMGPLTREALAAYQGDHGLVSTAALDQPTLASLGMG